jgi:broad specificity phosphatase PhoE
LVTRVFIYNDATHLQRDLLPEHPPRVILFRHAETEANVDGRWYGRSETPLTEAGRRQAADLAAAAVSLDLIASSPLSRARDTAASVAAAQKRPVNVVDGLAEMHFGEWEGLTAAEAEAADPEGFRRVYHHGVDEARGRTGETFDEAGNRFAGAVRQLTAGNNHRTIGLFTHGGVARAYIAGLLGVPFADRQRLPELRNTAYAEVVFEPRGTRVASYNVAPHLER